MTVQELCEVYGLPQIKREGLTEIEYNHRLKYFNTYSRLIEKCLNMDKDELSKIYCEVHHILPKCLGGSRKKFNLVKMPIRYHIMAHIVLTEAYPTDDRILTAAFCMINGNGKLDRTSIVISNYSTRTITRIREIFRDSIQGENNKLYGKTRPDSFKEKVAKTSLGDSNAMFGKRGEKSPNYGKPRSEETKKKLSLAVKGKPSGKTRKIKGPDGTIYESVRDASRKTGLGRDYITYRVKGLLYDNKNYGWSYCD